MTLGLACRTAKQHQQARLSLWSGSRIRMIVYSLGWCRTVHGVTIVSVQMQRGLIGIVVVKSELVELCVYVLYPALALHPPS
eukprot:4995284-Amphidinium_carterae.1